MHDRSRLTAAVPSIGYHRGLISCQVACPVHTDARGYVRAIAEGDFERAYLIARGPNPFASICGRICGAPCEAACRRGRIPRVDDDGNFVTGLTEDQFTVYEDGAKQEIELFAAGLDVFAGEPDIHPAYFDLPNVFMLPHIGSSTIEARRRMGAILIEALRIWSAGQTPSNQVC